MQPQILKIKNNTILPPFKISIESGDLINEEVVIKSRIHETIGDRDVYNFIGRSGIKVKLKLFFESAGDYDNFDNYITDGSPFVIECPFLPKETLFKLCSNINKSYNYEQSAIYAEFTITDADDPTSNTSIPSSLEFVDLRGKVSKKLETLDRLKSWSKKIFEATSSANQSVAGALTNKLTAYSAAITNIFQGIGNASTIITNPLSSVNNSIGQVQSGLTAAIDGMFSAVDAVRRFPGDIENMIDSFLTIGSRLNNLFDTGSRSENIKYNSSFLQDSAQAIIANEKGFDSGDFDTAKDLNIEGSLEPTFEAEYYVSNIANNSGQVMSVLMLSSILLELYSSVEDIGNWNKTDLEKLKNSTETIFEYITARDLDNNVRLQLILSRNNFFLTYKLLYEQASETYIFNASQPMFLSDIVYSVNGNFDYYDETKKLNGIIGSIAEGDVEVITNEG